MGFEAKRRKSARIVGIDHTSPGTLQLHFLGSSLLALKKEKKLCFSLFLAASQLSRGENRWGVRCLAHTFPGRDVGWRHPIQYAGDIVRACRPQSIGFGHGSRPASAG